MGTITPENRERYMLREMESIFESLEYRLFEKLQAADSILAKISYEAGACGVNSNLCRQFLQEKLIDMIDQIAERREAEKGSPKQRG